jgi:hypothetical protein
MLHQALAIKTFPHLCFKLRIARFKRYQFRHNY